MSKETIENLMQAINDADKNWVCGWGENKNGPISECSIVCGIPHCPKNTHLKPIIIAAKILKMDISNE